MRKLWVLVLVLTLLAMGCVSPWRNSADPPPPPGGTTGSGPETPKPAPSPPAPALPPPPPAEPYASPSFTPRVAAYRVNPDLGNVANLAQFAGLEPNQLVALARDGFCLVPGDQEQLFYVYEDNHYRDLPSFVTTDTVLQIFHLFYNYALRTLEVELLRPRLVELTAKMLERSEEQYRQAAEPVREAALTNIAYFTVAGRLLGTHRQSIPEVESKVQRELNKILAAQARERSELFPYNLDYTQFIVRGHYTRSTELESYFRAAMWLGLAPFPFHTDAGQKVAEQQVLQALLMTMALYEDRAGAKLIDTWEEIYDPIVFFVGEADDATPVGLKDACLEVYGRLPGLTDLRDAGKLKELAALCEERFQPGIKQVLEGIPTGAQFRFLGQRYIPDSEVLQTLSDWQHRPFPKGLDVPAAFGSDRARDLLKEFCPESRTWLSFAPRLQELRRRFTTLPMETWQSNLYYCWLWFLNALHIPKANGYPQFMQTEAWLDKSLQSTCASWAELRHDTVLYGKQSGAEMGGDADPELVKGYVEPDPEFYARMDWVIRQTTGVLGAKGYASVRLTDKFEAFSKLLRFLQGVAIAELEGTPLSKTDYMKIQLIGGELEYLTLSTAEGGGSLRWFELTSDADRIMACITDVHTSTDRVLQVGVGPATLIYVIVPIEGRLYITRGAVLSYYEFIHPAADRLTDEAWRAMLKEGKAPPQPEWIVRRLSP